MGSRLTAPPPTIRLWFDEVVVPVVSTVRLLDRSGKTRKDVPLRLAQSEPGALEFDVGKIDPGAYTMAWKVLSAVDGHVTRGVFAFAYVPPGFEGAVGALGTPSGQGPGQQAGTWALRALQVVAVWGHLLALLTITGICLVWVAVVRPLAPSPDSLGGVPSGTPASAAPFPAALARLLLRGALVSIAGGVVALQLEWLQVSDAPLPQTLQLLIFFPAIPVALGTWSSIAAFVRLALLTGVASLATRLPEDDLIALPGVLILSGSSIASVAVASHAAATGGLMWALPDFLHLAAASLWAGGLFLLARLACARTNDPASGLAGVSLPEAMRRFTPWASASVALLVATGILGSTVQVPAWSALWRTLYGGTLIAKVALLFPLLGLALLNTLWSRGKLTPGAAGAPDAPSPLSHLWAWGERRYRRTDWALRGEVALTASTLLCAAALTQLPPPKQGSGGPSPPITLTGGADDFRLAFTITSPQGVFGPSRVALTVRDARDQPPPPDARVIFRPEMLEREVRVLPVSAAPRGDGRYDAELFFSLLGRWDLEVTLRRKGREDASARFALNLGDSGFAQVDPSAPPGRRLSLVAAWAGRATRRRFLMGAGLALASSVLAGLGAARRRWADVAIAAGLLVLGGMYLRPALVVDTTPTTPRRNPIRADAKSLETGQVIYRENCAGCHGPAGRPGLPERSQAPPIYAAKLDLTADRMAQHTDGDLFWWISRGIPDTPMRAFGQAFSEEERWHLVNYMRSLRPRRSNDP